MPLTAADVRATTFATTRLHVGYNMDEVDEFLDIIEADVAQFAVDLQRSRDGEAVLRAQCDQLQVRVSVAERKMAELEAELVAVRAASTSSDGGAAPIEPPLDVLEAAQGDPEATDILVRAQQAANDMIARATTQAAAIRNAMLATLDQQRALLDRS